MNLNSKIISTENWSNDSSFLREFLQEEVFFELDRNFDSLPDGTVITSNEHDIRMQFVRVENSSFSLFYTTKENPKLTKGKIGGVPMIAAIEMVLGVPEIDGLLIQSDASAWVAVKKGGLEDLLKSIR